MSSTNGCVRSWCVFDLTRYDDEVRQLDEASLAPDFWSDPAQAQATMRRLTEVRADLALWRGLEGRIRDLSELAALVDAEVEPEMAVELTDEVAALGRDVDRAELSLLMSGPYDATGAILSIHAGAGGTESQDWAEMLMRMYVRWAENQRATVEVVDLMAGEEAGIKSTTMTITCRNAYGLLKSERGVHRLVRISPFDGSARRHTSFALVEVSPLLEDEVDLGIDEKDLRIDVFRSSGAGGQHVNKTSSAIRITHLPSGIVVTCQNERSQAQNRQTALKVLRARLLEVELEKRETEQARLKGEHVEAGWGNQIRSYVLHPYQMVKDHRTGYETGKTQAVLDGELDEFMDAYLRHQIGQQVA
jgi:peptide chain release factor 2